MATGNEASREAEFLRLLAASYHDLYGLALAIAGKRNDADDVIQKVCVVLWQKYDEFEPGTNFRKWACSVAFHIARAHVRKERRSRGEGLSEEALAKISQLRSAGSEVLEMRQEILRECVGRLSDRDRSLLSECYKSSTSLVDYARLQGRTVSAVYSKLKRIRRVLTECVHRHLSHGDY